MNSNELYDEFLGCCENYEIELDKIILRKDENVLKFYKPNNPQETNYLIYDLITYFRESGFVDNVEEMKKLSEKYIGINFKVRKLVRNKIKTVSINPYGE